MEEWLVNGCALAWLINPEESLTYVYSKGSVRTVGFDEKLSGQELLDGFEIQLKKIFKN
jgi:hypothetical protein